MLLTPAATKPVADLLRSRRRRRDDADRDAVLTDEPLEVGQRAHLQPGHLGADERGVGVDEGADREAAGHEPAVVGQGVAQVTEADDHDGPVLAQPELAGDLVDEVVDVVADPAGAVGAQVGEVLAQLGGVDPGRDRQLLG